MSKAQRLAEVNKGASKEKKDDLRGLAVGGIVAILIIFGFGILNFYMSTPQTFGDRDKVIEDIYRYHNQFGTWPQSLEELKSELPDYQFKYHYFYILKDGYFVVGYKGSGLMGEDSGGYRYRSDTEEWKAINSNR